MMDASLTRIVINFPALNIMSRAALKASKKLLRDFGEVEQLQVSRKGPGDFVSAADHRAETIIREELEKARKGCHFLLEESGAIEGGHSSNTRWIVDPLDGTTNFLHGLPHFCISIALEEHGEVIAGLTYDPILDEMFYAAKNMGAFLNERRIKTSLREKLPELLVATSRPHPQSDSSKHYEHEINRMHMLTMQVAAGRRMGSAALDLCYTAMGRFDLYVGIDLSPWDTAAGFIIAREAGAMATDLKGGDEFFENRTILVANEKLHQPILEFFKKP